MIFVGLAKPDCVVLKGPPVYEQNVAVVFFNTLLKLMGNITRAVGNDRLGCAERLLEFVFLAGYDVKNGDF